LVQVGILAVFAVFFRVLIMGLYNVTGRSVLLVGLFHSSFNMVSGQQMMPQLLPGLNTNLLVVAIVAVLAVVLAISTRGRLGHESERGTANGRRRGRPGSTKGAITNAPGSPCDSTLARRPGTTDRER
jgi:hypothetical protein